MDVYTVECWGLGFRLRADFSDASCPIEIEHCEDKTWMATPHQVATFCHSPELAVRWMLEDAARDSGDDPESAEIAAEIDAAMAEFSA
jgi:hypothetical protein